MIVHVALYFEKSWQYPALAAADHRSQPDQGRFDALQYSADLCIGQGAARAAKSDGKGEVALAGRELLVGVKIK